MIAKYCVGDYVLRECYVTYVQVMLMRLVTHRNASPSFSTGGVEFRGVQAPPATPEPAAFKIKGNDVRVSLGRLNLFSTYSIPFLSDWKARLVSCDLQNIRVKISGALTHSVSLDVPGVLFLSLLADWCRELVPIPDSCAEAIDILGDLRRKA